MNTFIVHRIHRLAILVAAVAALGGCAVYDTGPGYGYGYYSGGSRYYSPSTLYVSPTVRVTPRHYYNNRKSTHWKYRTRRPHYNRGNRGNHQGYNRGGQGNRGGHGRR